MYSKNHFKKKKSYLVLHIAPPKSLKQKMPWMKLDSWTKFHTNKKQNFNISKKAKF